MDGWLVIGTDIDTKGFDKQINYIEKQLEEIEYKLEQADMGFEVGDTDKLSAKYEKLSQQLTTLKKKQSDLNKTDLTKAEQTMQSIGNNTETVIKKIGRWALAVFSLRSVYAFISRTSSTLAQYNKEYGANLEYIRFVLAQAIAPVLQFIVNLSFKLLNSINAIVQALFGVNLFSKASVKDFQKMSGSAASIKKSLQTAGFDEMNVLSDSSSGGGGGFTSPTIDITKMEQLTFSTITNLLDRIKGAVGRTFDEIGQNISTVLTDLGFSEEFVETFELAVEGVKKIFEGLYDIIKGVLEIIWGLLTGDVELVKQGFKDLLLGISEILSGAIQGIIGIIKLIWLALVDIFSPVGDWIWNNIILPIWNFTKGLFETIVSIIKTAFSVISGIFKTLIGIVKTPFDVLKATVESVISGAKKIITGFRDLFKGIFTGDMKLALEGFKNIFRGIFESLWGIVKAPLNLIIGGINSLIDGANRIKFDVPSWVPGIGGQKWGFNISKIPMLRTGAIINNPGYGVPVGGGRARGGEAGAEGILPLTDSQAMETLGEAIGRYITINANIVNNMNGRVLSRQLQQIKGNQDFAYNK